MTRPVPPVLWLLLEVIVVALALVAALLIALITGSTAGMLGALTAFVCIYGIGCAAVEAAERRWGR